MARKKIGELLVENGLITPDQLEEGIQNQPASGKRLGEYLLEQGLITDEQLTDTIAERLAIPRVTLGMMVIDPSVLQIVPVELARRYTLIPIFAFGNSVTLAMADPLNILALDEIRYLTGKEIKRAIATTSEIKDAINQYYSVTDALGEFVSSQGESPDAPGSDRPESDTDIEVETPIIKLVDLIITKAVKAGASDIHIEPDEAMFRIRYRISGVMREEASPPKSMQNEMISRIKIAASLDLSEKRLPQDGRLMMKVDYAPIDLRISTLPTIHGEKIVIRILDRRNLMSSYKDLGFRQRLVESWQNLVHKPEGLILISGPTSSGKTSTLYATLQDINSVEKNIITVEDPVEYSLPLINQIQINEKAGLTFPSTLRSILRQNPDIIMIGEIRDAETAQMAVRSALTGHLVLSTIHTNDAPSAITRLVDMDIESYLLASALKGVLAQRLVRVNCPKCLTSYRPSEVLLRRAGLQELVDDIDLRHGVGCTACKDTGFKGQTGIYEFIEITPSMTDLILSQVSISQIKQLASQQGYLPLFEAGLEKLINGTICLEELLKETSNVEDSFGWQQSVDTSESSMPAQYKYKAVSETGKHEQGVISAVGSAQVEEHLRERNLLPIKITAVRKINALSFLGFLRANLYEQLIMLTNSLSTMYRAGIPLLRALSIIRIGKADGRFNQVLDRVRSQIHSGKSLSEAMRDHNDVFSDVYISCVAAGEESGQLEHTLDELSNMLEHEMELNRQVKSAIRYPAVVILIMIGAFFVLMSYVIPQFVEFYSSFDAELPLATRVIIGISNAVVSYWPLVLLTFVALGFMYKRLVGNAKGRLWHDRQLLRLPVIGNLIIKGNVARFCLMFRILFDSGLPLIKSLSVISQTIKNAAICFEIAQLEDIFRRGQETDILAGNFQYIPDLTLHMISIGLESGDLGNMLKEVGDHYSKQVKYTSQNLTAIIEPILTVVLGGFVLILALAIFLPMWNLIKVFSG